MIKTLILTAAILLSFLTVTAQTKDFDQEILTKKTQIEETQAKMKKHICYNNFLSRDCTKVRAEYDSMEKQISTLESEIKTLQTQKFEAYQASPQGQIEGWFQLLKSVVFMVVIFGSFGLLCFAALKIIVWYKRLGMPRGDEHGTARPATTEELITAEIIRPIDSQIAPGEIQLGIYGYDLAVLPKKRASRHIEVIGTTGSGKTLTLLAPNIVQADRNESLFITDVKARKGTGTGELWLMTSGYRPNSYYCSPMEPEKNMLRFNWIPELKDNVKNAMLWAQAVVENGEESHWTESAISLLSAIWLHTATTEFPNPVMAHRILMQDVDTLRTLLEKSPSYDARISARQYLDAPEREGGSILSVTRKACKFMLVKEIKEFFWTNTATDFKKLREESTSIYYQMRESDAKFLKPLNSLLFTYMMSQLKTTDGLNIKMLLDEFANIGKIPNFENDITLLRDKEISLVACLQSHKSQLEGLYGRNETETIINNFNTQIALPGLEFETAKAVSNQMGTSTVIANSSSSQLSSFNGSVSTNAHGRPLLTPDEVSTMNETDVLIFRCSELRPFMVQRKHYDIPEKAADFSGVDRTQVPTSMQDGIDPNADPFPQFPEFVTE